GPPAAPVPGPPVSGAPVSGAPVSGPPGAAPPRLVPPADLPAWATGGVPGGAPVAVAAPYGHTAVDPAAGAIHGHQPATLTAPRGGWGRRLLRQSVNPFGIAWAAVSPEKRDVMATLATRYNTSSRLFDGRCARVDVFAESSGVTMESLAGTWNPDEHATKPRPQVWIPASSAWLVLLAQRGPQVKLANADKAGRFPSVAKSPLVLAVPKSIADNLGGTIGWADLLRIAGDSKGWSAAHPGTGAFKL